jgi:nitrite reductase/ring-hydroxylating ferredoxin subunit
MNADWMDIGCVDDIPDSRAKVVTLPGRERVAVFRYDNRLSAVSNVCKHQGGPLGEGKILNGCITCPWHGWDYRPHDGCAPPPFTEKLHTYRVKVQAGRIQLCLQAIPPGTHVEPALIQEFDHAVS